MSSSPLCYILVCELFVIGVHELLCVVHKLLCVDTFVNIYYFVLMCDVCCVNACVSAVNVCMHSMYVCLIMIMGGCGCVL